MYKFIGVDFSGVEARITAWCAGQQETLDIFWRKECVYCAAAADIFGKAITKKEKDERQVGKCGILGLGFGGGINAYYTMCQMYDVSLAPVVDYIWGSATDKEKDSAEFCYNMYLAEAKKADNEYFNKPEGLVADVIKQRWRAKNPKVVRLWADIEQAAINAVKTPGFIIEAGRVKFYMLNLPGHKSLEMELPSGRTISYPKAEVRIASKFGKDKETLFFLSQDAKSKQWLYASTYGGRLLENAVQGIARDLMVEGMHNVRERKHKINLTIHDEVLARVKKHVKIEDIEKLMLTPVPWAVTLPTAVEGWEGLRFKKA